jgi:hypothetical protein
VVGCRQGRGHVISADITRDATGDATRDITGDATRDITKRQGGVAGAPPASAALHPAISRAKRLILI